MRRFLSLARVNIGGRLIAAGVLVGCMTPLVLAAGLNAEADGHGTHEQLGLPACSVKMYTDYPCPSCGMTTAFAHAADGRVLAAFAVQPAGAMLALVAAVTAWVSLYALVSGARLGPWLTRLWDEWRAWIVLALLLLIFGSWAYTTSLAAAGH